MALPPGKNKKQAAALSLIELVVSIALISVITTVLVIFYRSARVEFEHSMGSINMGSSARRVAESIIPYVSTAVPISTNQGNFLYSPLTDTGLPGVGQDPTQFPNVYTLDFSTSCDLLNPSNSGRFASIGQMNNVRGTGQYFRYRVRFDVQTGRLLLERVQQTNNGQNVGVPSPIPLPLADESGGYFSRILGRDVYLVTFHRSGNSIGVKVVMRTRLRNGRWLDGQVERNLQGASLEEDPNDRTKQGRRGREYTFFTTVLLPYFSGQ